MPVPRVLMVTGAYFPELSGGGLQCKVIVDALGPSARFLVLTTSTDPTLPAVGDIDGTPVHRVPIDVSSRASTITAGVRIAAVVVRLRNRFDIVHLHGFSRKSLLILTLARLLGKKVILTIHTARIDEWSGARGMGRFASWCYARADLYTAVSDRLAANYVAAGLPADRLRRISNAVDLPRFQPATADARETLRARLGLSRERIWILFVGFFSRDKAPDVLFDAWMHVQADLPSLGLVFVGATRSPYFEVDADLANGLQARARAAGVTDRVRFVEATPAVEDYFRAADIFVMPSVREGFGMAAVEAMACELPVIASRLDGVTDTFVTDGDNGILVPPGDARAIADAIRRLVADPGAARRLASRGRAMVERTFSVAAAAEQWHNAYDHLVNDTKAGRL